MKKRNERPPIPTEQSLMGEAEQGFYELEKYIRELEKSDNLPSKDNLVFELRSIKNRALGAVQHAMISTFAACHNGYIKQWKQPRL